MPKVTKVFELEVRIEHFLLACSPAELHEVSVLLDSPLFQSRMNGHNDQSNERHLSDHHFSQLTDEDEKTQKHRG